MSHVSSLRTHLVDELTDLLSAEDQLTEALPKMAASASTKQLKTAFQSHLKQTRRHIQRLNKAMQQLGEKPAKKTCEAMEGLLAEGEELMNSAPEGVLRDVVMITAAQKVEHYEIATYGTVRTYAQVIGEPRVARLLEQTLEEEKAADVKLTVLAVGSINERAAQAYQEQQGMLEASSEWVGDTMKSASRGLKRAASAVGLAGSKGRRRSGAKKR